eukprot:Gb_29975 [translate_table: standard]
MDILKRKNAGAFSDSAKRMKVNVAVKGSHHFVVDENKENQTVLANIWGESAELVPTHGTMSESCPPPDFSIWTAEDDLLLKNALEAGAALEALAKGAVRFSRRFTGSELRERWHALLYNPEISAQATARMVEVELSHTGLPKPNRSNKLKGKEETVQKRRLDSVRNHYYSMKKRIDAETALSLDENCTVANNIFVACNGNENESLHMEATTSHAVLPVTVCIEGATATPSFGLSGTGLDIEDRTFSQMVSFLAAGGVEAVVSAFPTSSMDSFEVNSAAARIIPNGHYAFPRHDSSVILNTTPVGSGNQPISTGSLHNMAQVVTENAVTIHDSSYIVGTGLPSDIVRTNLNTENEAIVKPLPMADQNPGDCRSMGTCYVRREGFGQEASEINSSALGIFSQPGIRNWEADAVFSMPSVTVDVNNNADKSVAHIEDNKVGSSRPKEPQRHGHLIPSSLITKEDISITSEGLNQCTLAETQHESLEQSASVFLADNSEGAHLYGSGDGHCMLDKGECLNIGYNILVTPLKTELQANPPECLDINVLSCSNKMILGKPISEESGGLPLASASVQASQELDSDACKLGVIMPETCFDKSQPLLFVNGPMNCTLNTEDTDIPSNDEFNPPAFQEPSPISSVFQSTCLEQTTTGGSLSAEGISNKQKPCESGLCVKEEPETLETFVEAVNMFQPLSFKEEQTNKPCTDYHDVKMEVFECTAPLALCQDMVARKEDYNLGISSSTVSNTVAPSVLQEGMETIPLVIENTSSDKFDLLSQDKPMEGPLHSNDCCLNIAQPLEFEMALPVVVHDNVMQVSQFECVAPIEVGLKDSQEISSEEAAVNQFPGNQEDQLSDSEGELPHFSDVEAMILDMDLDPGDDEYFSARAESKHMYRRHKKAILRLEQTANSAMQRSLASKGAFAILYGRHLRYFMRKNEVSMGRVTQDNTVDIDLGKEGRANKVSRRQATITLKEDGVFYLENRGRRAIAVNSNEITNRQSIRLSSNCLIEVGGMKFIFEMNKNLVKRQIEQIMQQARYHG